ncbi:hypothetical protein [Rhizobium halophytocola]|uniref:Uncharacterized protein n=1 Tax=Rhizobium halophytocola TaxID=735519 RepID=A0ABS4E3H6_9HYPH|nr:hypothetical protein [Rhizobium halophytocola]MBP1852487.1 hypothetical protein [Rhizobium halophytocola]
MLAKVTEAASDKYHELVAALSHAFGDCDRAYLVLRKKGQGQRVVARFEKQAATMLSNFSADGADAAKRAWDDVVRNRREYRGYKVKAAVELGKDGLQVAKEIVGAIGINGFALAKALLPIAQRIAKMGSMIHKLSLQADALQARIDRSIAKLRSSYQNDTKKRTRVQTLVSYVAGSNLRRMVESIIADNEMYAGKLKGLDVSAHRMASELAAVMKSIEKLASQSDVKASPAVSKSLAKLEGTANALIGKIVDLQVKQNAGMRVYQTNAAVLERMATEKPDAWEKMQEMVQDKTGITLADSDYKDLGLAMQGMAREFAGSMMKHMQD